ncbi:MAG: hypothetical protein GY765_02320 [bacterium]|nr:hypothetical protein [bacterium]
MKTRDKILIIDASVTLTKIVTNYLKETQFEIISATSGKEGVALAALAKPDLIILDCIVSMSAATSGNGTAGEKGTGFGMPIVKSYVQFYGGYIRINSKCKTEFPPGHGTEINLVLKKAGTQGDRFKFEQLKQQRCCNVG